MRDSRHEGVLDGQSECDEGQDASTWQPWEVLAFVRRALAGHPSVRCDAFRYTSGFVFLGLSREDLFRLTQNEDAAEILDVALKELRELSAQRVCQYSSMATRHQEQFSTMGAEPITVFVQTPDDGCLETKLWASDTLSALKRRIAEMGGPPVEEQRIMWQGRPPPDASSLEDAHIHDGAVVRLVCRLPEGRTIHVPHSRRGLLLLPGGEAWRPRATENVSMVMKASKGFPQLALSLEFENEIERDAFALATRHCPDHRAGQLIRPMKPRQLPPLVQIPGNHMQAPVLAKALYSSATGVSRLEVEASSRGGRPLRPSPQADLPPAELAPHSKHKALVHLDGRIDGKVKTLGATLVVGGLAR